MATALELWEELSQTYATSEIRQEDVTLIGNALREAELSAQKLKDAEAEIVKLRSRIEPDWVNTEWDFDQAVDRVAEAIQNNDWPTNSGKNTLRALRSFGKQYLRVLRERDDLLTRLGGEVYRDTWAAVNISKATIIDAGYPVPEEHIPQIVRAAGEILLDDMENGLTNDIASAVKVAVNDWREAHYGAPLDHS